MADNPESSLRKAARMRLKMGRSKPPSIEVPDKDGLLRLIKTCSSIHTELIAGSACSSSSENIDDLPPSEVLKRVEALKEKIATSDEEISLIQPPLDHCKSWCLVGDDTESVLLEMMKHMQLSEPNDNEHSKQVVLAALDSIIELLDMDIHCDLIMLYYRHYSVFGRQSVSDLAVDYICSTLGCSQSTLNIIESDSEGLPGYVAGLFSFKMDGIEHFCSNLGPYGKTIPPRTKMATDMKNHGALFVLLAQNSSVFITLTQYGFVNDYQCILIAGEDFPTTEIISFTKKVSEELKLPLFCLLNWDPVNLRILSGCGGAGPTKLPWYTKWLGIWPSDAAEFKIPTMKPRKAELMKIDYLWKKEPQLRRMLHEKAEVDAFCAHGIKYASKVFLPFRLKQVIEKEIEKFPDRLTGEQARSNYHEC